MSRYKSHGYDTVKYPFEKIIKELFEVEHLSNLHAYRTKEYNEAFQVGMDSSTEFHTKFYDKYRAGWDDLQALYDLFIKEFIGGKFKVDFLYQKFPTFRVHLPGNLAVGAFHNDAEFGHPAGEINFILPLTNSDDTASVWIESEPGLKDFEAAKMRVGQILEFNGNELTHGNKMNDTNETRVSMDFRILPISKYDENNQAESITRKTKFKEGEYYKRFSHGVI